MRKIEETVLEGYDLGKITKLILNKSIDGETLVQGIVIDTSLAEVILSGVSDESKGKALKESKYIKGTLLISLDKNNYDIIENANYEYVQSNLIQGNKVVDLFRFIEMKNERYIIEI